MSPRKIIFVLFIPLLFTCRKDEQIVDVQDYPRDIGKILVGKCATAGCHNDASYENADGLNLSSWEKLFVGTESGAAVIPYNSEFSSLTYFINTYPDLGLTNTPTMPVGGEKLSREEVALIKNWINSGAPNVSGKIAFSGNPNRRKFYVAHSACKVVCVFDAETSLQMRYIKVVNDNESCTAHQIKLSPDGKYWYVCYTNNGKYLRRYSTIDESFAGEIYIGGADWNTFSFTPDSKKAFVVDWTSSGKVATCDLVNMVVTDTTRYSYMPHGSAVSPNGQFLYFTATTGNFLYKKNLSDNNIDFIALNSAEVPGLPSNVYNAHEILFSSDGTKYYVTCQNEKTVRVFDALTDNCIASIPISGSALEMSLAPSKNLLFVTSWDANQFAGVLGAVAVINTVTNTLQTYVNAGTEPHGISVDEQKGLVYIANRNISSTGPLPHHSSVCGGKNGYVSFIDLNTLDVLSKRIEVSADPYSIALRP